MRVHHFNAGAMQPYGGALFDGLTPGFGPSNLTCHCLLLETSDGLALVDTGTVGRDPAASAERLDPLFRTIDRPRLNAEEAASNQVRRLGHDPAKVRHVIMTHLDFDHAAGLIDFPDTEVHLSALESNAARHPDSSKARRRYRPGQWGSLRRWHPYAHFLDDWFGLPATDVHGVAGVKLVWLPGHTDGHCAVAIDLGGSWLLHAGDAVFNMRELDLATPRTPPAARMYQWYMETSQIRRRRSLRQLRNLLARHGEQVQVVCTHDPAFFADNAG